VEGYIAWALCTVLTKVVYICSLDYQNAVSCSILGQFVLFNLESEDTLLANHWVSVWHCLALLSWQNMVSPSVSIQFA
jgi:hypothetical protein